MTDNENHTYAMISRLVQVRIPGYLFFHPKYDQLNYGIPNYNIVIFVSPEIIPIICHKSS